MKKVLVGIGVIVVFGFALGLLAVEARDCAGV